MSVVQRMARETMNPENPWGGDGSRGRKRKGGREPASVEGPKDREGHEGETPPAPSREGSPKAGPRGEGESPGPGSEDGAKEGGWDAPDGLEKGAGVPTASLEAPEEAALREELAALQADLDRLKDQHLRLAADFENYRRRMNQELASAWVRAQADLIRSLVEVMDDLERVREHAAGGGLNGLVEGVGLVERKLQKVLADAGLVSLDPVGELFDPGVMEAVARVPASDPALEDRVQQVYQKGYRFRDHLVRPARVSVFKTED